MATRKFANGQLVRVTDRLLRDTEKAVDDNVCPEWFLETARQFVGQTGMVIQFYGGYPDPSVAYPTDGYRLSLCNGFTFSPKHLEAADTDR